MLKNRGIAFKLILFYTLAGGLIFLLIFVFSYRFSRAMIEKNVEDNAQNLVNSKVNRIETVLLSVQKIPESLAAFLENGTYDREELLRLLRALVENNPEIYGAAVAFEPHGFDRKSGLFAPYCFKRAGRVEYTDLGKGAYGYADWDWYQIPREMNKPLWSEPYFDEGGGNALMATYSVPFYRRVAGKRELCGIVTADINLGWLQEVVSSIKVLQSGYGFLLSKNGTILTHPIKELTMNETIFGVAEARNDAGLREIGRKMIAGGSGFVPFKSIVTEEPCWMYYTPIPANGWSLAVLFPQQELTADVRRLNRTVVTLAVVGLLLISLAVAFIARSITGPLREMVEATKTIAVGNLDFELPPATSGDEVGKLSAAFRTMKDSLKEYIRQLTETTASKERMESELKIAHDIQMGILPKTSFAFPDRPELDIYAVIEPAREVGGDFYDYFFVDDRRLCFVIGDVSGKGIPAALFMAVTKTLIKATALKGIGPGLILTEVNRELSQRNDSCMFATIFCGIVNTETGELAFANAGHNVPLLVRRNQEAVFLKEEAGLVAGAMEDSRYETEALVLGPDDSLFLYTDGVTEAMNGKGEFFSEERLRQQVDAARDGSVQGTVAGILDAVVSFAQGTDQSDDITMMMVRFRGKEQPA